MVDNIHSKCINPNLIKGVLTHLKDNYEDTQRKLTIREEELENTPSRYKIREVINEDVERLRTSLKSIQEIIKELEDE